MAKTMEHLRERHAGELDGKIATLTWVLSVLREGISHAEAIRRIEELRGHLEAIVALDG